MMKDEQTCGKGLAEHSVLPRRMALMASALGAVLHHHLMSLDGADDATREEREAYSGLAEEFRAVAASLAATSDRMAGYRDLPMAPHDTAMLASDETVAKFERFVRAERDLLELLKSAVERDNALLGI